jgi:subtilisin family serine protease
VIRAAAAVLAALATAGPAGATVDPELAAALRAHASVHVIVAFRDGPGPPGAGAARASRVERLRTRAVALAGAGFHPGRLWTTVMAMPGTATRAAVARLAADPDVARVGLDPGGRVGDAESGALIGAPAAAAAGLTGRGVTVAVIDTGIDRTHPDLASSVVAEHCVAPPDGCPNVTGEQDGPGSARDDAGHGSNVAGIVTADGVLAPRGIAPDAGIVAVRVTDANDRFGSVSQVISALDWVSRVHPEARVLNLSLGTDELFAGTCDAARSYTLAFASAVATLRAHGAVVFASSMNNANPAAIAMPACLGAVEAVGAVYDSAFGPFPGGAFGMPCADGATAPDAVTCFSNSGPALDLLAPGAIILSAFPGSRVAGYAGTSQASPHAAAVAALLLQAQPLLTPDQVEALLSASGRPVTDPRNALVRPRVDIPSALAALAAQPPPPPPGPPPAAAVAPARLAFGRVRVGRTGSLRLTVRNVGGTALLATAAAEAPFAVAAPRRLSVAPGRAATFLVRFVPRRALAYRRTLTLTTNAPARARIAVALSGRGAR